MNDPMASRTVLERAFLEHYQRLKPGPPPAFTIDFYPYVGLSHTIRSRVNQVTVRISDILADAPDEILTALMDILLCKLFRRPSPSRCRELYREYVTRGEVRRRTREVRKVRSRKYLTSPTGLCFDLRHLFDHLNQKYFSARVTIRHLSWSRGKSRKILAHFDPAHQTIVVSRKLDHPLVPRFVVEYVLYHEMLHALLGEAEQDGRRLIHSPDFRRFERAFADYARARDFIRSQL